MTVEVFGTDEFEAWFLDLSAAEQEAVINVVTKLEIAGVALGRPHAGHLEGTKEPLREDHLRVRPEAGCDPAHRRRQVRGPQVLRPDHPRRGAALARVPRRAGRGKHEDED